MWIIVSTLATSIDASPAEVAPVTVRVPEATAWIGQRVPLFVEIRATGPFAGTASFDLPQLPGVLLLRIGNPVVSSQNLEGSSFFVQTHEFALFSQKPGMLEVPPFSVRFARREGFTGPVKDVEAQAPGLKVEIRRPPGSDGIGFLITTESLDVSETWDPVPGPAQVGAVFKRTIVQRAPQLSGMALAPAPTTAPDGVRVYPGDAVTKDRLERGDFLGERRETITYLLASPGIVELPALAWVWWNPKERRLQSKTLPAVTFDVAPLPAARSSGKPATAHQAWPWLLAAALAIGVGAWQRRRIVGWGRRVSSRLNPPDRVAARDLRRACRRQDAVAAEAAWVAWRNTQGTAFELGPGLRSAVLGLERHLFGPGPAVAWRGGSLSRALRDQHAAARARFAGRSSSALPSLNPDA